LPIWQLVEEHDAVEAVLQQLLLAGLLNACRQAAQNSSEERSNGQRRSGRRQRSGGENSTRHSHGQHGGQRWRVGGVQQVGGQDAAGR